MTKKQSATSIIKDIKRKTRYKFSAEEKIRIVLEVFKAEEKGLRPLITTVGVRISLKQERNDYKEIPFVMPTLMR
jgi:hypothetical protein